MSKDQAVKNRFMTPVFVLSYPNLYKARKNKFNPTADPRFGVTAIWTPAKFTDGDKKKWAAIRNEAAKQLKELFKAEGKNLSEVQKAVIKRFPKAWFAIRSGTEADFAEKAGYGEGTWFASLSTTSPPGVIDIANAKIHPTEGNADEIYPGCYCRATIQIQAYKHESGGTGYAFYLGNLQKIKDGKRLDSRVAAEDDFNEEVDGAWIDEEDDAGNAPDAEEEFG